jgi:ribosomal protein S18 acetylase RimI-like enzyme
MLRHARPADFEGIAALHTASWRTAYRGALSDDYLSGDILEDRTALWQERFSRAASNQLVLVAEEERSLLGFACAYLNDHPHWGSLLDNIHVGPDSHRRGVGSTLLRAVASVRRAVPPWSLSRPGACRGAAFYRAHGAETAGTDIWEVPEAHAPAQGRGRRPVGA